MNTLRPLNKKYKTIKVLSRDSVDYFPKSTWKPLFMKMGNHERVNILTLSL